MKKLGPRVTACVAGTAMAFSLAGCGSNSSDSGGGDPNTLEVWSRSGKDPAAAMKVRFEQFTKDTGIKVNYLGDPELATRLQNAVQSRKLPDVIYNDGASMEQYRTQGIIMPINKADFSFADKLDDNVWASATSAADGKIYGIPYSRHAWSMVVRTDWLKKLGLKTPKTFEDYVAVAEAFQNKDPDGNGKNDTYGFTAPLTAKSGYAALFTAGFLWSDGGDYISKDGKSAKLATPESISGVTKVKDLVCRKPAVVQPSAVTDDTTATGGLFADGAAGIGYNGPWALPLLDRQIGKDKFTYLPEPVGKDGSVSLAEGENLYWMAGSKKTEQIKKLMEWMLSSKGQEVGIKGDQPSVRISVRNDVDTAAVKGDPRLTEIADRMEKNSRYFPININWVPIRAEIGKQLNAVYSNCGSDVSAALTQLDKTVNDMLAKKG